MITKSPLKKSLYREGAWAVFGTGAAALGTLVGIRLITEIVPKEVYGTVSLLVGLVILGSNFLVSPFTFAAQRFHPEAALSGGVAGLRRTIVGILKRTVGVFAIATLLGGAVYCLYSPTSYLVFILLAVFLVVQAMKSLETSLLSAARRQRELAIWNATEAWTMPMLVFMFVLLLGATPQSMLFGYFLATGGILRCFHLLPVRLEGINPNQDPDKPDRKLIGDIWRYATPIIPLALVGWINSLSDRYFIGGMLGLEEVGIYAATYGLISRPFLMVGGVISLVLRPVYFQAVSTSNKRLERKIFRTWITGVVLVCILGVAAIYFLRDWISLLLLAEEYRGGTILMPWIAAGIGFQVITHFFENVFHAYKRTRHLLLIHSIGAVVCVLSVTILVGKFGLTGAAMACPVYFLSMLVLAAILIIRVRRRAGG